MKRFAALLVTLSCIVSCKAEPREAALQAMVGAERAFAALAAKASTREAFLTYLAEEAIVFNKGPRNGKEFYSSRPADDSLLSWTPVYADMAASGDFGYDTGPYTYRQKRDNAEPQHHGDFVTIWKRSPGGEWRAVLDAGCSHLAPEGSTPAALQYSAIVPLQKPPSDHRDPREAILNAERTLITRLNKEGRTAYETILATEARRLHRGLQPAIAPKEFLAQLDLLAKTETLHYEPLEAVTASSGELGYVYGWVTIESPAADKPASQRSNYLRIWKRVNESDWRLVLELAGAG